MKLTPIVSAILLASSLNLYAAEAGDVEVNLGVGKYYFDSDRDIEDDSFGLFGLSYYLNERWAVEGIYTEYSSELEDTNNDVDGTLYHLDAVYHYASDSQWTPYSNLGIGRLSQDFDIGSDNDETLMNVGGGVKYNFAENWRLRGGADAFYSFDEQDVDLGVYLAVGYLFGSESKSMPAESQVVGTIELNVEFPTNKANVSSEYYAEIKRVADFMMDNPETTAEIDGHTDSVGDPAYNKDLSQRRADAVKNVLVDEHGVSSNRLSSVGYGEEQPVGDNNSAEGRQQNRRVVAVFSSH